MTDDGLTSFGGTELHGENGAHGHTALYALYARNGFDEVFRPEAPSLTLTPKRPLLFPLLTLC